MSVVYSRPDSPVDWLKMTRLEVQIWNVLTEGPRNAWEIYTRLPLVSYSDVVNALARMEKMGNVSAEYSH